MDVLRRSQPARVVCVSSFGHEFTVPGGIDFTTLDSAEHHNSTLRYGTSKLCNILFVKALARRFANEKIYVSAVNPGWVATDLQRHLVGTSALGGVPNKVVNGLQSCVATRPQDGALTQLFAATSPEIEEFDLRGRYFIPVAHEISPSKYALDEGLQEKLWEYSIKLMNEKIREE